MIYLLPIVVIVCCVGCISKNYNSIITPEIWSDLDIYSSSSVREGIKAVDILLENKENIDKLLNFVERKLSNSGSIPHRDQIKLAIIVLKTKDSDLDDHQEKKVNYLIDMGEKHHDFYRLVLSVERAYILTSLKVFTREGNIFAFAFHPDAGKVKRNVKEDYLSRLVTATNQNFGYDYDKWKEWWLNEGQYMKFDSKKKIYF